MPKRHTTWLLTFKDIEEDNPTSLNIDYKGFVEQKVINIFADINEKHG